MEKSSTLNQESQPSGVSKSSDFEIGSIAAKHKLKALEKEALLSTKNKLEDVVASNFIDEEVI